LAFTFPIDEHANMSRIWLGMIGVAAELIAHGAMKWSRERSNDNGI
jgi:hypothetical protein